MKKFILLSCLFLLNVAYAAPFAEKDVLQAQLLTVDTGFNSLYLEHLYPAIIEQTGKDLAADAVASLFYLAEDDYLTYIWNASSQVDYLDHKSEFLTNFETFAPQLIRAILPNSPDAANKAVEYFERLHTRDVHSNG